MPPPSDCPARHPRMSVCTRACGASAARPSRARERASMSSRARGRVHARTAISVSVSSCSFHAASIRPSCCPLLATGTRARARTHMHALHARACTYSKLRVGTKPLAIGRLDPTALLVEHSMEHSIDGRFDGRFEGRSDGTFDPRPSCSWGAGMSTRTRVHARACVRADHASVHVETRITWR